MPLLPEGPEQARDLSLLSQEHQSAEAFFRLWSLMRDRLVRVAIRFGLSEEGAEDVVQSVSATLWERRESLAKLTIGAFWAYAFRSVKNLAVDHKSRQERVSLEPFDSSDLVSEDVVCLDAVVGAALERDGVYAAADRLWLGNHESEAEAILAVQLCLTHDVAPDEVAAMLGLSPESVRSLAQNPLVARHATYSALMWPSENLASYVLNPEAPPSPRQMEEHLRLYHEGRTADVGHWSTLEAAVVILRVRYGMAQEDIARFLPDAAEDGLIDDIAQQAIDAYPFVEIATKAAEVLRNCLEDGLRAKGLWQRLVFEYHLKMQLPHRQILERIGPAGATLGVELKATTLNSWIGNGRLWSQIAAFVAEEGKP